MDRDEDERDPDEERIRKIREGEREFQKWLESHNIPYQKESGWDGRIQRFDDPLDE